ncbi:MAG: hypothetical protein SGBAC_013590 [Bacillariaceae sp.]
MTTKSQVERGDSAEQQQQAEQEQSQEKTTLSFIPTHNNRLAADKNKAITNNTPQIAADLQHQIVALQGRNQATELMLQRKTEENEKLLETIVQLSAENMILQEKKQQQQQQQEENDNDRLRPLNDDAANNSNDGTKSSQENGAVEENTTTIATTATVEELQDTVEHLQNRLMHQVEEKLILQTKVETLEHLLVEEKGALKSTIESMTAPPTPKRRSPTTPTQVLLVVEQPQQQAARQADIIREALERKKAKNLRARIGTKVYNSEDQKIDVQAYQELYEEQEKQKRLDQRIRIKRRPASETKSSASTPASSSILQQTTTDPGSSYSPSTKVDEATLLHKIGSQHLTTRLWDFDDWEVQSEKDKA